ncbi:MAG: hypothetical protein AAB409_04515 [Gemmatimonadota bacterium]
MARLDYAALSRKLVGSLEWLGTRHYIGQVRQVGNTRLYADQRRFLAALPGRLDGDVFHDLLALARKHQRATVMVEKALDVMLAVDMVVMAERNEFDGRERLHPAGPGVVRRLLQTLIPPLPVLRRQPSRRLKGLVRLG